MDASLPVVRPTGPIWDFLSLALYTAQAPAGRPKDFSSVKRFQWLAF